MFDILQLDIQTCGLKQKLQPLKERIIFFICGKAKTLTKNYVSSKSTFGIYGIPPTCHIKRCKIIT